jgi:membrane fusion protein, multidrug efflux system
MKEPIKAFVKDNHSRLKTFAKDRLKLSKPMFMMLGIVGTLIFLILAYKIFGNIMMKRYFASNKAPVVTVSAQAVSFEAWQPKVSASGSIRAIFGTDVTTEVAGMVNAIHFKPGAKVQKEDLIVDLNADSEIAQLHSFQAALELSKIVYKRDSEQYAINAISKAVLDADLADLKSKEAQVESQMAIVAKKKIVAPFSGTLGISMVNPGQYLNPGDKIVTLQSLDPIYVDFYVPQQKVESLKVGLPVKIQCNAFPKKSFTGVISTIDPKVDPATRNIQVEATVPNLENQLLPGMFAFIEVETGKPERTLTLPQTAIFYYSYGNVVYIVKASDKEKDAKGKPLLNAIQTFVTLGETRGDQIAIKSGLKEGDQVVTSGQLKLKNGSPVVIDNSVLPSNEVNPKVQNEE